MSMFRLIWSVILTGLAAFSFRKSWTRELGQIRPLEGEGDLSADSEPEEDAEWAGDLEPEEDVQWAGDELPAGDAISGDLPADPDRLGPAAQTGSVSRILFRLKKLLYNPDAEQSTSILTSPATLIGVIIAFPLSLLLELSPGQSLSYTCYLLLEIMILFTVFSVIMLGILSLLREKISARACAAMWLAPALLSFQVWLLYDEQNVPLFQLYLPPLALQILFLIWLGGFLVIFTIRTASGLRFSKEIWETASPEQDPHILAVFAHMQEQLGYSVSDLQLLRCPGTESPFAMGGILVTKAVVLPEKAYSDSQLRMIFSHELHHLQRGDVKTKLLLVFLTSLCWFDPLVWVAARKAVEDLELSCDEIVTAEMDEDTRKQYALLLLGSAGPARGFTTCLSAAAGVLRYRMKRIITTDSSTFSAKHKTGTICFALAVFLCCMSFGSIGITDQEGTFTELFVQPDSTICAEMENNEYDPANSIHTISLSNVPILEEQLDQIRLQKINSYGHFYSKDSESDSGIFFWISSDGETSSFLIYHDMMQTYTGDSRHPVYYKILNVDMAGLEEAVEELP